MFAFNLFKIKEVTNSFQNIDNIIYKCYDSLILLKDFIKKIIIKIYLYSFNILYYFICYILSKKTRYRKASYKKNF